MLRWRRCRCRRRGALRRRPQGAGRGAAGAPRASRGACDHAAGGGACPWAPIGLQRASRAPRRPRRGPASIPWLAAMLGCIGDAWAPVLHCCTAAPLALVSRMGCGALGAISHPAHPQDQWRSNKRQQGRRARTHRRPANRFTLPASGGPSSTMAAARSLRSSIPQPRHCSALLRAPQPPRAPLPQPPPIFVPAGKPKLRYNGVTGGEGSWLARAAARQRRSRAAAAAAARGRTEPDRLRRPRTAAAAVGLHDGINLQKPSLMADTLERQPPAPPIRCACGGGGSAQQSLAPRAVLHHGAAATWSSSGGCGLQPQPSGPPTHIWNLCPRPAARATPSLPRGWAWSLCGGRRAWTSTS